MCKNGKIITVRVKNEEFTRKIQTDCNSCVQCQSRKATDWTFRCYTHSLISQSAYFVTLTLDNQHITDAPSVRDIQLFHKRLRKNLSVDTLKFFLVSEYGYETERLHYHAVYFDLPFTADHTYIQISNTIARSWQKGIVYTSAFQFGKIAYCLKYLHKDKELGNIRLSSKNLGNISEEMKKYINSTSNMEGIKVNCLGRNIPLPRYFRKKFMCDDQKERFTDHFVRKAELELADVSTRRTRRLNFEQQQRRFTQKH